MEGDNRTPPTLEKKAESNLKRDHSFHDIYQDDNSVSLPVEETEMTDEINSGANKILLSEKKCFQETQTFIDITSAKQVVKKELQHKTRNCEAKDENDTKEAFKGGEKSGTLNVDQDSVVIKWQNQNPSSQESDIDSSKSELDNGSANGGEFDGMDNTGSLEDSKQELDVNCRPGTEKSVSMTLQPNNHTYKGNKKYIQEAEAKESSFLKNQPNPNDTIDSQWRNNTLCVLEDHEPNSKFVSHPDLDVGRTPITVSSVQKINSPTSGIVSTVEEKDSAPKGLVSDSSPENCKSTSFPETTQLDNNAIRFPEDARPKDSPSLENQATLNSTINGELQEPTGLCPAVEINLPWNKAFEGKIQNRNSSNCIPKTIIVNGVDDSKSAGQGLDFPGSLEKGLNDNSSPIDTYNTNCPEGIKVHSDAYRPFIDTIDDTNDATESELQETIEPENKALMDLGRSEIEDSSRGLTSTISLSGNDMDGNTSVAQELGSHSSAGSELDTDTSSINTVNYATKKLEANTPKTNKSTKRGFKKKRLNSAMKQSKLKGERASSFKDNLQIVSKSLKLSINWLTTWIVLILSLSMRHKDGWKSHSHLKIRKLNNGGGPLKMHKSDKAEDTPKIGHTSGRGSLKVGLIKGLFIFMILWARFEVGNANLLSSTYLPPTSPPSTYLPPTSPPSTLTQTKWQKWSFHSPEALTNQQLIIKNMMEPFSDPNQKICNFSSSEDPVHTCSEIQACVNFTSDTHLDMYTEDLSTQWWTLEYGKKLKGDNILSTREGLYSSEELLEILKSCKRNGDPEDSGHSGGGGGDSTIIIIIIIIISIAALPCLLGVGVYLYKRHKNNKRKSPQPGGGEGKSDPRNGSHAEGGERLLGSNENGHPNNDTQPESIQISIV